MTAIKVPVTAPPNEDIDTHIQENQAAFTSGFIDGVRASLNAFADVQTYGSLYFDTSEAKNAQQVIADMLGLCKEECDRYELTYNKETQI